MMASLIKNRRKEGEKGIALITVLCFLAIGSLTIVSLLNLTYTGIRAGHIYDEKIRLQYAADAGLEEALWRMQNDELPFLPTGYGESTNYTLADNINGKDVSVNVTYIWPLEGLETDTYGTDPPDALKITGGIINLSEGKYKVQISYDGSEGSLPVNKVAVWLPSRFEYIASSSTGITVNDPVITWERGGKLLTWSFSPAVNFLDLPNPSGGGGGFVPGTEFPASRKLYFYVTPLNDSAGGSFSWVRTTDTGTYLAWETGCALYNVTSTASDNSSGMSYSLAGNTYFSEGGSLGEGVYQIKGSYRAVGNTLMRTTTDYRIRDLLLQSSSANITNIPGDAEVVLAYLYWSGWRSGVMQADTSINLYINGQGVYFDDNGTATNGTASINASRYWLLAAGGSGNYAYSSFCDVTDLVRLNTPQGNAEYTVANVTGSTGSQWSYAGWSLIVFYSSASEQSHQIFLYDTFLFADSYTSHTFTIEGFEAPADAEATLTSFVGEGDLHYGGYLWNCDYIKFNGVYLFDAINPKYNVWNGKSSGLGGLTIDGVDIDSFNVSSPIIESGDTSALVQLGTGIDSWSMIYIVLSFSSEYSGLTPNAAGIIAYSAGY